MGEYSVQHYSSQHQHNIIARHAHNKLESTLGLDQELMVSTYLCVTVVDAGRWSGIGVHGVLRMVSGHDTLPCVYHRAVVQAFWMWVWVGLVPTYCCAN